MVGLLRSSPWPLPTAGRSTRRDTRSRLDRLRLAGPLGPADRRPHRGRLLLSWAFSRGNVATASRYKPSDRNARSPAAVERFRGVRLALFPAADGNARDSALCSLTRDDRPRAPSQLTGLSAGRGRASG